MTDTFNLTAAFDKATYNPGDLMTLTVSGTVTDGTATPVTASIVATASDSETTTLTATATVGGQTLTYTIAVTDSGNRTWTINGNVATATA